MRRVSASRGKGITYNAISTNEEILSNRQSVKGLSFL